MSTLIEALYRPTRFLLYRRRAGKIAQLPPAVREQINLLLHDNLPYADIIARLGDIGKHLNKDNLSRWRKADHQDWLAEQTWLEATRGRPERQPEVKHVATLLHEFDSDSLHAAMSRRGAGITLPRVINSAVRMATTAAESSTRSHSFREAGP